MTPVFELACPTFAKCNPLKLTHELTNSTFPDLGGLREDLNLVLVVDFGGLALFQNPSR